MASSLSWLGYSHSVSPKTRAEGSAVYVSVMMGFPVCAATARGKRRSSKRSILVV